jgi:sec-independent protein translocase protein TatB
MYEFRKVSNEFKFQMEEELRASEEADRQKKLAAAAPPAPTLNLPFSNTPALDAQAAENPTPELALAAPAPDSPTPSELTAAETTPAGLSSENPASESAVESQPESQPFPNPQPVHGVVAAAKPFRGRIPEPPPPPPDHSLSVAQTEAAESEPEARHA